MVCWSIFNWFCRWFFFNGCPVLVITSNKLQKQEVESHPRAVNHSIPKGFVLGLAAVSVSLCPLMCISRPPFSLFCPESWDVKNMMIHSLAVSFSAVIWSSRKLESETGVMCGGSDFWNRPLNLCFMKWIVTVDVVGQAAVDVMIHRLHSCCTAFCYVCVRVCVSLWTNTQVYLYTQSSVCVCMLAHVVLCMYVCICVHVFLCPGQRSQSYPRITEGLKSPWPSCWSRTASVFRATALLCSQTDIYQREYTDR